MSLHTSRGLRLGLCALALVLAGRQAWGQAGGAGALQYRVNYRPSASAPWQVYAQTRSQQKAETIAQEVRQSGYLAEVVPSTVASPQPYPDMSDYSASDYYPTSNWTNDYNYYLVPGGRQYNYGWYGGWNPWYLYHSYPWYARNGGGYWHSGWWRGHGWNHGWRGWGWHEGWNNSHRYWNHNHIDRASHFAHHERHNRDTHHQNHMSNATRGHRTAGHHAAAHHGARGAGDHHGTNHFAHAGRRGGRAGAGHRAGGHALAHRSAGGHAAGHHAGHLDP